MGTLYGIDLSEPTQENIDAVVALELGARRAAIGFADVLYVHWRELTALERQTAARRWRSSTGPTGSSGCSSTSPSTEGDPGSGPFRRCLGDALAEVASGSPPLIATSALFRRENAREVRLLLRAIAERLGVLHLAELDSVLISHADLHDHGPQGQVDASARLRQRGVERP